MMHIGIDIARVWPETAVATTYDKFTQGFQTADLRTAKRLLSEP